MIDVGRRRAFFIRDAQLLILNGHYAEMFEIQAERYR